MVFNFIKGKTSLELIALLLGNTALTDCSCDCGLKLSHIIINYPLLLFNLSLICAYFTLENPVVINM